MNASTVSSFWSRDIFLKRQVRTRKRPTRPCPSTSFDEPLSIIVEEDECRLSSSFSRSSSPASSPSSSPIRASTPVAKSKRRHANLSPSEIRIARATLVHCDNDISEHNPTQLSSPRPAPSPPSSSASSPDSFRLKFLDSDFRFPHPPIPTPTSTFTHDQSRARSESPTPSMTSSSSPDWPSAGLPMTPSSSDDEFSYYYSQALPPVKPLVITKINSLPTHDESYCSLSTDLFQGTKAEVLPTPPSPAPSMSGSDDSDSEWYAREFSDILRVPSRTSLLLPHKSRPDSICSISPTSNASRTSPNAQIDPSFPRRQRRNSFLVPKYPPPPVPTSPSPKAKRTSPTLFVVPPPVRRPPPRSSIPADCVFVDDDTFVFSDDDLSAFSLSFYDDSNPNHSPKSVYSQPSPFPPSFPSTPLSLHLPNAESPETNLDLPLDETEVQENPLPRLSIPCSPTNLEADIALGLEQLRLSQGEESESDESLRALRSRWSSSTLASVHEDHARLSASAKLRSYFSSGKAVHHYHSQSLGSRGTSLTSPVKSGGFHISMPTSPLGAKRFRHARRESDVMAMGYGYAQAPRQQGLRRRGSTQTVSDAGSEESTSSSGSNGLRRKPIPVEMFLRSAP